MSLVVVHGWRIWGRSCACHEVKPRVNRVWQLAASHVRLVASDGWSAIRFYLAVVVGSDDWSQ